MCETRDWASLDEPARKWDPQEARMEAKRHLMYVDQSIGRRIRKRIAENQDVLRAIRNNASRILFPGLDELDSIIRESSFESPTGHVQASALKPYVASMVDYTWEFDLGNLPSSAGTFYLRCPLEEILKGRIEGWQEVDGALIKPPGGVWEADKKLVLSDIAIAYILFDRTADEAIDLVKEYRRRV